jgi:hypothetical protein
MPPTTVALALTFMYPILTIIAALRPPNDLINCLQTIRIVIIANLKFVGEKTFTIPNAFSIVL